MKALEELGNVVIILEAEGKDYGPSRAGRLMHGAAVTIAKEIEFANQAFQRLEDELKAANEEIERINRIWFMRIYNFLMKILRRLRAR